MPLTTAELAQKKKFLIDAILWKKEHPGAEYYKDIYSYNDYVFKQSLRFLPREFTRFLQFESDEAGTKVTGFTPESVERFVNEVYREKDSQTIAELINPETTPLEPEKAVEEFDQGMAEQEAAAKIKEEEKKKEKQEKPETRHEVAEPEEKEIAEEAEIKEEEPPVTPPASNTVETLPGLENTQPVSLEPPTQETG